MLASDCVPGFWPNLTFFSSLTWRLNLIRFDLLSVVCFVYEIWRVRSTKQSSFFYSMETESDWPQHNLKPVLHIMFKPSIFGATHFTISETNPPTQFLNYLKYVPWSLIEIIIPKLATHWNIYSQFDNRFTIHFRQNLVLYILSSL